MCITLSQAKAAEKDIEVHIDSQMYTPEALWGSGGEGHATFTYIDIQNFT